MIHSTVLNILKSNIVIQKNGRGRSKIRTDVISVTTHLRGLHGIGMINRSSIIVFIGLCRLEEKASPHD
jgi:hypothetical protein